VRARAWRSHTFFLLSCTTYAKHRWCRKEDNVQLRRSKYFACWCTSCALHREEDNVQLRRSNILLAGALLVLYTGNTEKKILSSSVAQIFCLLVHLLCFAQEVHQQAKRHASATREKTKLPTVMETNTL